MTIACPCAYSARAEGTPLRPVLTRRRSTSGSSGSWSNWDKLGDTTFRGKPAVVSRANGAIDVFMHGNDAKTWQLRFANGAWGSWSAVPGSATLFFDAACPDCSSPAAGSRAPNLVDVWVRGTDNKLFFATFNGTSWGGFSPVGGVLSGTPATVSRVRETNRADIVVIMPEGRTHATPPAALPMHFATWWKTFTP